MITILILIFSILTIEMESIEKSAPAPIQLSTSSEQINPGLELLERHCYICHNPKSKSHDEIIAPPLWGMKKHYLEAYPAKEDFENAMLSFIQNPTEEKALMKGPIKRFGLMPKPAVSKEDLQKIVAYIYSNELENPQWHIEKDNEEKGKGHGLR